jgi:hypothetical protein
MCVVVVVLAARYCRVWRGLVVVHVACSGVPADTPLSVTESCRLGFAGKALCE